MTMPNSPDDHISSAREYLLAASQCVWRDADRIPFTGEDPSRTRHIENMTRMATLHLQFASTLSLLEGMKQSKGMTPEELKSTLSRFKTMGTVTGRLESLDPVFHSLDRDLTRKQYKGKLPDDFTMASWHALREHIIRWLEEDNSVTVRVPGGNKFIGEKMVEIVTRWGDANGFGTNWRIEGIGSPETIFKAWVTEPKSKDPETLAEPTAEQIHGPRDPRDVK